MKCRECPDYAKCVKESNLAIKRKNCPKAKMEKVKTNADCIRAMSDEELAKLIYEVDDLGWCKSLPECIKQIGLIPEEKCIGCALEWLKQPAEVSGDA